MPTAGGVTLKENDMLDKIMTALTYMLIIAFGAGLYYLAEWTVSVWSNSISTIVQ
jgi:hypothetical protein